jgi:hypothetical protein
MYLVLSGNEFGIDLMAFDYGQTILFIPELEDAEGKYKKYLEEYGCVAMYKMLSNKMELIKQESNF